MLEIVDRFTRSRELLREFLDDTCCLGLEFLRVFTVLDANKPSGISNTFLEFLVLDRPAGLVQPIRSFSLVGPGIAVEPIELPFQVGDLFVHGLLTLEETSSGRRTRSVVRFPESIHVGLDITLLLRKLFRSPLGILHIVP